MFCTLTPYKWTGVLVSDVVNFNDTIWPEISDEIFQNRVLKLGVYRIVVLDYSSEYEYTIWTTIRHQSKYSVHPYLNILKCHF